MKQLFVLSSAVFFVTGMVACGGGEPTGDEGGALGGAEGGSAVETEATGAITMPEWVSYDEGANTASVQLHAGQTGANNAWNYNGLFGGTGEIFVPVGAEVTVTLTNDDQNMAHSLGVDSRRSNFPANFSEPEPVFAGAITSDPTSLTEATLPGESESITFTADEPGEYSFICYVPGHAAVGMYIHFTVTDDGTVGFRG